VTEESGRSVAAAGAQSGQARDLVGERYTVQHLTERVSVEIAVQTDHDDVFIEVLDLAPYKQHEVVEELRLVDDDEVHALGYIVGDFHEVGVGGVAGHADAVVGDDLGVEGVAVVPAWFDDEDARPDASVALDRGGDEGGLAGKHGTHHDLETHSAVLLVYASSQ